MMISQSATFLVTYLPSPEIERTLSTLFPGLVYLVTYLPVVTPPAHTAIPFEKLFKKFWNLKIKLVFQ